MVVLNSGRELLFSPYDPVRSRLLQVIGDAKRTVDLKAYTITLEVMVDALCELRRAGREIRVIISGDPDAGHGRKSKTFLERIQDAQLLRLRGANIPYVIGLSEYGGIEHGKYGIVDSSVVFHGSYNFTAAAETQGNHICIEHERDGIRPFIEDFERTWTRLNQ